MHSKLYKKWVSNPFYSESYIKEFLESHTSITLFSKDDFIVLQKNPFYGNSFDNFIVSKNVWYLVKIMNRDEIMDYINNSNSYLFQYAILEYFVLHIDEFEKECLEMLQLKKDESYFYRFLPLLFSLCLKNKIFLEYITMPACFKYVKFMDFQEKDETFLHIINDKECLEYFLNHIDFCSRNDIIKFLKKLKKSDYFNETYEKKKEEITVKFLMSFFYKKFSMDQHGAILLFFQEILSREGMELFDLEMDEAHYGSFCQIFFLKRYLLKIGRAHLTYEISNSSSLLYPMVRKQINDLDFYIEVENICDTNHISLDDVYTVYKEERQKGNVWLDPKEENLGRLLFDNGDYPFDISPFSVGFVGENETMKKRGDFVILDLDLFFREGEIDWTMVHEKINIEMYENMEKRYQKEMGLERKRK